MGCLASWAEGQAYTAQFIARHRVAAEAVTHKPDYFSATR